MDDRIAPPGKIWQCTACGKRSGDLYGDGNSSWDESCVLNAVLVDSILKPALLATAADIKTLFAGVPRPRFVAKIEPQ
jgi:DNA-directed RNA polymerase beta' subunit